MKFVVSSTELLSHLSAISRVINSKNTLPILDNYLFLLEDNRLTVTASDLESTLITSLELEKHQRNWNYCCSGKKDERHAERVPGATADFPDRS